MDGNFGNEWKRVPHLLSLPDSPTVLLFLENYCAKNPTHTVNSGTLLLINEIGVQVIVR